MTAPFVFDSLPPDRSAAFASWQSSSACPAGFVPADDRPNIVMAFADDWGKYASAYARLEAGSIHDHVSTPNFDSVANDGVLFTRAFVERTLVYALPKFVALGPTFLALWSGVDPAGSDLGHVHSELSRRCWNRTVIESDTPTKFGVPARRQTLPHGGAARSFNRHGRRFNGFSQNAMKNPDHEAGKAALLDEVRQNVRSFLDANDDGKLDGDSPFCYWFGPTNCHRKWIAGSGKELWGINPDDLKGKHTALPARCPNGPRRLCRLLGRSRGLRRWFGSRDRRVEEIGAYDNTLLVVSGDHGIPGCHAWQMQFVRPWHAGSAGHPLARRNQDDRACRR